MKIQRSEKMKLLPLAILLIITPLLSTSLRFKYLYFIINILIISVGAEAGLFSFFLHSEENPTPPVSSSPPLKSACDDAIRKPVKESALEPSIFFIEDNESEDEDEDEDEDEEDGDDDEELMVEESNGEDQELYHKSEKFIGNFYKQLKMQREEFME